MSPPASSRFSGAARWTASALVAAAVGVVACSGARTEGLDARKVPENVRSDYEVFAHRCSKCHSLARPLTAGITDDQQWVMYVNRMRRQPGSGISYEDQERILRFFRWYAAELRLKEAAKRGAAAPSTAPELLPDAGADAAPPAPASAPPSDAGSRTTGGDG